MWICCLSRLRVICGVIRNYCGMPETVIVTSKEFNHGKSWDKYLEMSGKKNVEFVIKY